MMINYVCSRTTVEGRLASSWFDAWANAGFIASLPTEWRTLDCCTCTISWISFIAWIKVLIYMMVANSYGIQNTEDNKSFLWHKQLNYNITAVLQITVNTYANPAELLGANQSRILHLSCSWKELVFPHVHRWKAHISGCKKLLCNQSLF